MAEMDADHHRFIAGELKLDGVRYAPTPQRLAAMRAALGQRYRFRRLNHQGLPRLRFGCATHH